ncbi:MAG: type I pullulanase, partial [Cyclobacteriaceae bacterium]
LTDPEGWNNDTRPALQNLTDAIIYELHIRDFSIYPNSGIKNKGKYLAFTEPDTNIDGIATGVAHLRELGITHLHILPGFDFRSIDESQPESNAYNWGYDPQNYNVPEGSYATDAENGEVRIREFKEMVMSLHNNGFRVIMDVVYNHTGATKDSNFNQLYPGYYYRLTEDGKFSNASACGNETASEKPMMRKFMLESIRHWIEEYHIDGFRFDLMGIHDLETMNLIAEEVRKIDPTILLYGEGWTAGDCMLEESKRAVKANTLKMPAIAVFSDEIRDGIKGHWSDHLDKGFVSSKADSEESVKFGIVGATDHTGVDFTKVNYAKKARANGPWQTINYVACHDDMTLFDKLKESTGKTGKELEAMHLLANTIVLTSQGIPFLHAGADFLRTKYGNSNSYQSPDSINQLDWDRKRQYVKINEHYRKLIAMRKEHPVFRLKTSEEIQQRLEFTHDTGMLIAYTLDGTNLQEESWDKVYVIFNGSDQAKQVNLPSGEWKTVLNNSVFYGDRIVSENMTIEPSAAVILRQNL